MKIALVLITPWWRASIDFDGLAAAFARQGHEPILVCHRNDAGPAAFPVIEATPSEYADPAFWQRLGVEGAILYSWLQGGETVRALRRAGVRVLLRADHDGTAGVRVFPKAAWRSTVATAPPGRRLHSVRHWLHRWLRLHRQEDAAVLSALEAADAVAIESAEAAANLRTFLAWNGQPALGGKLRVVPHSVADLFLQPPPAGPERPARIFCGGRWEDPQKDAPLLDATLEHLFAYDARVEVAIGGSGVHEAFGHWSGHRQVQLLGRLPREALPAELARSRFLLSSSRWETQPVGTLEALCCGCSIVAPELPGFIALAGGGSSGTLAARRTPVSLAEAALHELALWDAGLRDPHAIAARWRARVSSDAVAAGLANALVAP